MQIHTIEGGNKKDAQVFYTNCASFNYSFTNNVFVLRIFFLCAILLKLNKLVTYIARLSMLFQHAQCAFYRRITHNAACQAQQYIIFADVLSRQEINTSFSQNSCRATGICQRQGSNPCLSTSQLTVRCSNHQTSWLLMTKLSYFLDRRDVETIRENLVASVDA